MFRICTVLFVASIGMTMQTQAASQTEIAGLLDGKRADRPDLQGDGASAAESSAPDLSATCSKLAQLRTTDVASALDNLYREDDFRPLWDDQQRLATLQAEMAALADDGLIPSDYSFSQQATTPLDACQELRVSSEYLLALEHLGAGRLDQAAHEPMWREENAVPARPAVHQWAQQGRQDPAAAFEQARPELEIYRELRKVYIQLRDEPPDYETIPSGDLVRPGESDDRVPLLAQRLRTAGYLEEVGEDARKDLETSAPQSDSDRETPDTLNPALVSALERFQEIHGLQADGVLGPNTLAALNMPPQQQLDVARINLERLRWLNLLLQKESLLVNSAGNDLRHFENGTVVWQTKVITGRPGRETPILVSRLDRLTLNPDWTVPPTIRREDMFPEIRKDLDYLERKNLVVIDYQGNRLDPETIDWNDPPGLMIRQPPGPDNPLGQIVFRFPNPYSVYLHDTPDRHLFDRVQRNISSGCVRVEGADELGDTLISRMDRARQESVRQKRSSGKTHQVSVEDGPQIVLGYWTAEADSDGRLKLTQDPYGWDPALLRAINALESQAEFTDQDASDRTFP